MSHWECALPLSEMRLGRAHPSEKKREIHSSCQMHSTFQIEKGSTVGPRFSVSKFSGKPRYSGIF